MRQRRCRADFPVCRFTELSSSVLPFTSHRPDSGASCLADERAAGKPPNRQARKPALRGCANAGVGQTFQSAGSRNFPVPCFHLRAVGQIRMRPASRMNGRLESRPTGRLESLPYESARPTFFCGESFHGFRSGHALRVGTTRGPAEKNQLRITRTTQISKMSFVLPDFTFDAPMGCFPVPTGSEHSVNAWAG
jgi:hypothetical protein